MSRLVIAVIVLGLVGVCWGLPTVVDTASNANLTTFVHALQQALDHNLLDLSTGGPYTILVPSNDAFAKMSQGELNKLLNDDNALADVLKYHVIRGEIFSRGMINGLVLHTINGHSIRVYSTGNSVYINNAKVVRADIEANGAVIHVVDTVLDVPEGTIYAVTKNPEYPLSTFASYLDRVHLNVTLDNVGSIKYTVFAPSNEAFAKLSHAVLDRIHSSASYVRELIYYHVHQGTLHLRSLDRNSTISTLDSFHTIAVSIDPDVHLNRVASLEQADIDCDNGVVHVIDHVLIPSSLGSVIG